MTPKTILLTALCASWGTALMHSYNDTLIPDIHAHLERLVDQHDFSGVVLIAHDDAILLNQGYGYADREKKIPNTPATQFRIASITKPVTAALIMHLNEQGLLTLSEPITHYFPDVPAWREVTIHHLLSHTSGIYNFGLLPDIAERILHPTTVDGVIDLFRDLPLTFQPGSSFACSNSNYMLLTSIIEQVTGMPYEQALHTFILDPLGMHHSGYCHNHDYPRMAVGYTHTAHGLEPAAFYDGSWPLGSGGMYATAYDLYLFAQGLQHEKLMSSPSLQAMHVAYGDMSTADPAGVPDTLSPYGMLYGYGWTQGTFAGKTAWSHPGAWRGMKTVLVRIPDEQVIIVILSNIEEAPVEALTFSIIEKMMQAQHTKH